MDTRYKNLTSKELRHSNYPDSKFGGIFLEGVANTDYKYSMGFVIEHPKGPYFRIGTEKRQEFLRKGSEMEAEDALTEMVFTIRSKTGGFFQIHPFYGAIYGTNSSPITDFCQGEPDDNLSTIIYLNDSRGFNDELTREAVALGTTIVLNQSNVRRLDHYQYRASKANPNQYNRDIAIMNGLKENWETEFYQFNPHAKQNLLDRIRRRTDIPPAMQPTQENIADFINCLQWSIFPGLRVTQVNYLGLTMAEFEASTLPREKLF